MELKASQAIRDYCERLRSMRLVGAAAGVRELCQTLAQEYSTAGSSALPQLIEDVRAARAVIQDVKPATAIYEIALDALEEAVSSTDDPVRSCLGVAGAVSDWVQASSEGVAESGATVLATSTAVLVYDYSSSVMAAVQRRSERGGPLATIVVPECRITGHGWRVAELLFPHCAELVFVADSAFRSAASRVDTVLLGAESITRSGALVNTMGSAMLARAAADRGASCRVLSGAAKVDAALTDHRLEVMLDRERDGGFVRAEIRGVEVDSRLLEVVGPDLIGDYVMESGPVAPPSVLAAHSVEMAVLRQMVAEASGQAA